jgi:hypothetical protein
MEYLIYLSWYLMCGMAVMFILNKIHDTLIEFTKSKPFSELDRVLLILLWPIYLFTFIVNFIKGMGRDK